MTLTNTQRDGVIEQFVELVVDGMDTKDLIRYVMDDLTEHYEDCSDVELREYIDNYDEDLYDELKYAEGLREKGIGELQQ